jgi:hypothetical protein
LISLANLECSTDLYCKLRLIESCLTIMESADERWRDLVGFSGSDPQMLRGACLTFLLVLLPNAVAWRLAPWKIITKHKTYDLAFMQVITFVPLKVTLRAVEAGSVRWRGIIPSAFSSYKNRYCAYWRLVLGHLWQPSMGGIDL